jgi:hypothetical protein
MKLLSIEPTPSPNSMKLNVDEKLPPGIRREYKAEQADQAPPLIAQLLRIPGVKSVFRTADFLALDRKGNADWAAILQAVREVFGAGSTAADEAAAPEAGGFGEIHVLVQMYRGIPMQVRVKAGGAEVGRAALPERFAKAVTEAAGATLIRERRLEEFGIRYGEPQEILEEVIREIDATYSDERLANLVREARNAGPEAPPPAPPAPVSAEEVKEAFRSEDWRVRYAALERFRPEPEHLPILEQALRDPQMSVRRLAVVYLGDLRTPGAMPLLFAALKDPSPAVRRTAGDTLSDLGDPSATGPMAEALRDPSKLVRWRAARFLYEAGDESALDALRRAAAEEPEFEVRLQAEMAVARIERGEEAAGSVWQQMTRMRQQEREKK